jgi:4-hydroxybenzoate polyprenyltransferase
MTGQPQSAAVASRGGGPWEAISQPVSRTLTFIRFSHTIFAMPFALGAMLAASRGRPGWRTLGLIVLSMVCARTAAMTFNRLADWHIDQRNPRTAGRHRLMPRRGAATLLVVSALAFVSVTYFINVLCFVLSPLALAIIFFYSLTKRFTHYTQLFLGLALSVAPVGAWLAVTGHFALPPLVLALGVLLWVAGFDLIYATQDYEFDKGAGLHSLVVKLGIPASLRLAQWLHGSLFALLFIFGWTARLGTAYYAGLMLVLGALVYEHRSAAAQPLDIRAVDRAFFLSNAFVGAVFVLAVWMSVLL